MQAPLYVEGTFHWFRHEDMIRLEMLIPRHSLAGKDFGDLHGEVVRVAIQGPQQPVLQHPHEDAA